MLPPDINDGGWRKLAESNYDANQLRLYPSEQFPNEPEDIPEDRGIQIKHR